MKKLRWGIVLVALCMSLAFTGLAEATGTVTKSITNLGIYTRYRWTFVEDGGAASDSTAAYAITGKIVGVKFVETDIGAATTVKLLDAAGRDVLQGLFTTPEASATATDNDHYRRPCDGTNGLPIVLFDETVYIDISSGSLVESGYVDVIVETE